MNVEHWCNDNGGKVQEPGYKPVPLTLAHPNNSRSGLNLTRTSAVRGSLQGYGLLYV